MRSLRTLSIVVAFVALLSVGVADVASRIAADAASPIAAPDAEREPEKAPEWRIVWADGHRYLIRDGTWHAWSPQSEWVPLPPGWEPYPPAPAR